MDNNKNNNADFVDLMRKELSSIIEPKNSNVSSSSSTLTANEESLKNSSIFDVKDATSTIPNATRLLGGKEGNRIKFTKASILRATTLKRTSTSKKKTRNAKVDFRDSEGNVLLNAKLEHLNDPSEPTENDVINAAQMKLDDLTYLTSGTDRAKRMEMLDSQVGKNIDEDLQKMQLELKQSYELFQTIGQKFSSIDFSMLKNRIRDLHLNNMNQYMKEPVAVELREDFEKHCMEKRLDKLTSSVSDGFRRHPGEFGDIPELSEFFQACTQLEHGLNNLKKQRVQSNDLEKRLSWASDIAYERMDEIRNAVGNSPTKNF